MSRPFVSVIIPVFNDSERLMLCLQALERQTYPAERYEIIVIDNSSGNSSGNSSDNSQVNDDSRALLASLVGKFANARLLYECRPGSYAARNLGLSQARGEVLAFTDADCIPARDWLESGIERLLKIKVPCVVGGRIDVFPRHPQRASAVELYDCRTGLRQREYIEQGRFAATANLFTHRQVFNHIGLFDEKLKSGGDVEWGQRAHAAGYDLIYADDVCVRHPARHSLSQLRGRIKRVTGGFHTLHRHQQARYIGLGRGFLVDALPPLRTSFEALRDSQLQGAANKLKVVGVLFYVQYAQVFERIRLSLGAQAQR